MSEEKKQEENKFVKMDAKTSHSMVIKVEGTGDREYQFYMPFNSPLAECYNAAINTANEIARIYNQEVEKAKEQEATKVTDKIEATEEATEEPTEE